MNINRTIKLSFLLLAVMVFTMAMYGFANANTVPESFAGDGSEAVTGFEISNIHYTLNPSNPANVNRVEFTVSPAIPDGGSVYITLSGNVLAPLDVSRSCAFAGTAVTCDFTTDPAVTVPVVDIQFLRVIAAQ